MARPIRTLLLLASFALLWCGPALAAPPTEPPGQSGSAPGHQKHEDEMPEASATEQAVTAPDASEEPPGHAAQADEPGKPGKPDRSERKSGKDERRSEPATPKGDGDDASAQARGPAAPVVPPPASISAPGASGPHKVTICHNGHAITVDLHAARTHVGRHGDTYAPAGAKGRAACATAVRDDEPPTKRDDPATDDVTRPAGADPASPVAATAVSAGAARPHGVRIPTAARPTPAHGTPARANALDARHATLPFTGRSLLTVVLLALGLIGLGALLRRTQRSFP